MTAVDLTYYEDRASSLRLRLTLAALGTVLGIAIVGWFVSGRALRPIRAANARQRDFIADAAHEMRTPLAVIRASASQALSKPRQADEYVGALHEIESASESAGAAVNELLELARIDSGQFAPRVAPMRLDLLVEEVVAGIRVDGCTLTAASEAAITVDADYGLLRHAVENVVRNATTAVDRGGRQGPRRGEASGRRGHRQRSRLPGRSAARRLRALPAGRPAGLERARPGDRPLDHGVAPR